ncbi:MAG: hypothetical protein HYS60_02310 [Candidatus Wildermuthbacteria bacterium]|nr:hypothetical protein [Candidatus Wildermuthbacteria bacterium]
MAEKHVHTWEDWRKQLWYTPEGRLQAEFRTCNGCTVVEARSIEYDQRPAVLQPTIGVFAGIFSTTGQILGKRIMTGKFAGEIDLPGGGIDAKKASQALDERLILEELIREVKKETGIDLEKPSSSWKVHLPVVLKGGGDWAIPISIHHPTFSSWAPENCLFLSPSDVEFFARKPAGERILSGWGKRMHRMFLRLLCDSPNPAHAATAYMMLSKFHEDMGIVLSY